jgi:hypothetical protein
MLCGFMQNHAGPNNLCKREEKPKGQALHLSMESSILGSLHSFNIVFRNGPIRLAYCKKSKLNL